MQAKTHVLREHVQTKRYMLNTIEMSACREKEWEWETEKKREKIKKDSCFEQWW